jgi:hypothetical protein
VAEQDAETVLAEWLRFQARACGHLGSELYAVLLDRAAADVEARGPAWEVLAGHETDPAATVPVLRLMGAVNRLVLAGREPALERVYEGTGVDSSEAWEAFVAVLSESIHLRWDRYRYEADGFAWGQADSQVRVEFELDGDVPALPAEVEIVARHGCDASPIDPSSPEGRLTMLAYIWPDQKFRLERMRAALRLVEEVPIGLDREVAAAWTARMLAELAPGAATVVYHSLVMQYLGDEERAEFHRQIEAAGERATTDAPLAWLRMEPAGDHTDLLLTTWPGGEERHLAHAGYHGTPVELR